jgi:hypothetical protein
MAKNQYTIGAVRAVILVAAVVVLFLPVARAAVKVDPRLGTAKTAYVVPESDKNDDREVATCFGDHLPKLTPLETATSKADADIVFKVKAHVPSVAGQALAFYGNAPSARLTAELPDGTRLWADGAKKRLAFDASQSLACNLADELIKTLRDALHQALAAKKW